MNLTGSLDCQCGNASPRHAMATNAIVAMNTRAPNWLFSAIESFVNSCRSGGQFLPKRTVVHYYRVLQTPQQLASVMKSSSGRQIVEEFEEHDSNARPDRKSTRLN